MIAMKVEIRDSKLHLSGYVNAVERDSKVITTKRGKCVEQIAAGAFAASMADGHEVRMKLNHKRDIGSTADGVLTLKEDNIGLYAEAETDDEELMTLAGKGELRGWSFGFVAKDDELESRDGKEPRRRVKALDLQEVSILSVTPAYNGTSVEVRSYEEYSDTVEAYRDDKGNITNVTVSHRESDDNGSRETTTYTDKGGTATETVTRTHSYKEDAQALKNTIAQLKMKGYILEKRAEQRELEERYNPYHDPKNGRFTNSGYGGGIGALYVPKGYKGKGEYIGDSVRIATYNAKHHNWLTDESHKIHGGSARNAPLATEAKRFVKEAQVGDVYKYTYRDVYTNKAMTGTIEITERHGKKYMKTRRGQLLLNTGNAKAALNAIDIKLEGKSKAEQERIDKANKAEMDRWWKEFVMKGSKST